MSLFMENTQMKWTKSDLLIMEFIENHTDDFLFMSIGQLAQHLQVSEATISRFARHMGYHDFKEMKSDIVGKKSGRGAAGKIAGTLLKDTSFDVAKWFSFQQECAAKTLDHLNSEQFNAAAEAIMSAKRIYIHAKNASAAAAELLFFRLRRLGLDTALVPSGGSEVVEGIAHAQEGDLAIIFSFSKVSAEGQFILDYAKTAGYRTLALTSRLHAPCEQRADINLYVYRGEKEEYHSLSSAVILIDALILAISEKMKSSAVQRLRKIQKLKDNYKNKK